MSNDWLDQLDDDEETEAPEAEGTQNAEPDEQPEERAAEAKADEPEPNESGEEDSQPPEDDQPVNRGQLAAMLAEREKRQQSEREREEARKEAERYKRELEELRQSQQGKTQEQIPDPIDDGQGFQNWAMTQAQQAALNAKLELSEDIVRQSVGDDAFESVKAWWLEETRRNPHLVQEGIKHRNPWRYAHQQYQKNQLLSEVGEDPAAYKERLRQELLAELQQQSSPEAKSKTTPPPSLAKGGAGGAGESVGDVSDEEFFASVFKR